MPFAPRKQEPGLPEKLSKTSIDELLTAIKTVGRLQDAVAAQDMSILDILARLDRIEGSLAELNNRLSNGGRVGG